MCMNQDLKIKTSEIPVLFSLIPIVWKDRQEKDTLFDFKSKTNQALGYS